MTKIQPKKKKRDSNSHLKSIYIYYLFCVVARNDIISHRRHE